jgi:hypothetical protein
VLASSTSTLPRSNSGGLVSRVIATSTLTPTLTLLEEILVLEGKLFHDEMELRND